MQRIMKIVFSILLVGILIQTLVLGSAPAFAVTDTVNGNWATKSGVTLKNTPEAELMVRVGDIDNFGYGWSSGFDPFSGNSTGVHEFPWTTPSNELPGLDRIMVTSAYVNGSSFPSHYEQQWHDGYWEKVLVWPWRVKHEGYYEDVLVDGDVINTDGYTKETIKNHTRTNPKEINLAYDLSGITVDNAILQLFVDDFQPGNATGIPGGIPVVYQVTINGVRVPEFETAINSLDQSGPIGKLISLTVPSQYLDMVRTGDIAIKFDDPVTGGGDGYAIDFVKLLINPQSLSNTGTITGTVKSNTGNTLSGVKVSAAGSKAPGYVTTSTDGKYKLEKVPAGLAMVTASVNGYADQTIQKDVIVNQTSTLNFNLISSAKPKIPLIYEDPNTITNQPVKITIVCSDSPSKVWYSYDNSNWTVYPTGGFTVNSNKTIYAKSQGINGNSQYSDVASLVISNIDTSIPAAPIITQNPDVSVITSGEVTVTVAPPTGASFKPGSMEYSTDTGLTYKSYTSPFKVSVNSTIKARYKNTAGTQSLVAPWTVSNIKPPGPTLSANITAPTKGPITVTAVFSATANTKLYSLNNGNTWLNYSVPLTISENCTVLAKGIDAMNVSSDITSLVISNIDNTPPAAPVISSPTSGTITDNKTPTITGTAEAGSTVTLYDGSTQIGTTTADANGNWSITLANDLTPGKHSLTAMASDAAGNVSEASAVLEITIDTTAPNIKMSVTDSQNTTIVPYDTSIEGTDYTKPINKIFTPILLKGPSKINFHISGTSFNPLDLITQYSIIRSDSGVPVYNRNNITWTTLPNHLTPNDFNGYSDLIPTPGQISVKHYQYAGNYATGNGTTRDKAFGSPLGDASQVLVQKATTGNPDSVVGDFNEVVAANNGTAFLKNNVAYNSRTEPVAKWGGDRAMKAWGYFKAPSDGTYKFSIYSDDGAYGYLIVDGEKKVFVNDWSIQAANDRTNSVEFELESGKTYPIYMEWFEGCYSHRAFIPKYSLNSSGWQIMTNQLYASSNKTPGEIAGAYFEDTAGVDFVTQDGIYYVAVKSQNKTSTNVTEGLYGGFIVDRTPPNKPSLDLATASDTGVSNTDNITNIIKPTLTGTAQANSIITLYEETNVIETGTANESGIWSINLTSPLTPGSHTFTATAKDPAGNESAKSDSLTVTIVTAASVPTDLDLDASSDTGISNTDDITTDTTPTINGKADPGATVTLYEGDKLLGTSTADSTGIWRITPGTALGDGIHNLTAKASDAAGNMSAASTPLTVTIDTAAPDVPGVPDLVDDSDTGISKTDNITNTTKPTLTGNALANSIVTLYDGTTAIGTTTANGSGIWSITLSSDLTVGSHTFTATTKDLAGNESKKSPGLKVIITAFDVSISKSGNGSDNKPVKVIKGGLAYATVDFEIDSPISSLSMDIITQKWEKNSSGVDTWINEGEKPNITLKAMKFNKLIDDTKKLQQKPVITTDKSKTVYNFGDNLKGTFSFDIELNISKNVEVPDRYRVLISAVSFIAGEDTINMTNSNDTEQAQAILNITIQEKPPIS